MWRLRILNSTFILLLLTIITMHKFAPGMQYFDNTVTEPSENVSQVSVHSVALGAGYLRQISASLARTAGQFAQVWERAKLLVEWPLENDTAQWDASYAPTTVEKDLLAARFHVENAEVYEWAIKNRQKTVAELNQAEHFLENARPSIKKPVLKMIETVTRELEVMKTDSTGDGASRPANYETVKTDLDQVIDWVRMAGL